MACTAWKNPIDGDVQAFVNDYKRALLDALIDAGVSDWCWIMRGVRSVDSPFLPNPHAFAKLCVPASEDVGMPSQDEAFRQAVGNSTAKSPAVVFVLRAMGGDAYEMRRADVRRAREIWAKWWPMAVRHKLDGGDFPEPERQVEHRPAKAPEEVGKAHLSSMRGLFE